MPVVSKYSPVGGASLVRSDYEYRVVGGRGDGDCQKCGGRMGFDLERFCVNCGWCGPTQIGGATSPEPVMAGGKSRRGKRTRTKETMDKMRRVYELRQLGIASIAIAEIMDIKPHYVTQLYYQYVREVLGE